MLAGMRLSEDILIRSSGDLDTFGSEGSESGAPSHENCLENGENHPRSISDNDNSNFGLWALTLGSRTAFELVTRGANNLLALHWLQMLQVCALFFALLSLILSFFFMWLN